VTGDLLNHTGPTVDAERSELFSTLNKKSVDPNMPRLDRGLGTNTYTIPENPFRWRIAPGSQ
jgi:hypothetical protein